MMKVIIPLNKLITYQGNRYIFTKAMMEAVDRIGNIRNYPEDDRSWKVVPNVLKLMLDDEIKFEYLNDQEQE